MSKEGTKTSLGGISFLGGLALLFIGLKLGGVIDWSWWLVLLPLWGPWAMVMAIFVPVFLVVFLMTVFRRVG